MPRDSVVLKILIVAFTASIFFVMAYQINSNQSLRTEITKLKSHSFVQQVIGLSRNDFLEIEQRFRIDVNAMETAKTLHSRTKIRSSSRSR